MIGPTQLTHNSPNLNQDKVFKVGAITFSIKQLSEGSLKREDNYKLFEAIFINPTGNFADPDDTQAITKAMINLVKTKMSMDDNYKIFEYVFINPTGILADLGNHATQEIAEVIIKLVERNRLHPTHNYRIFKHLFVKPTGILANLENIYTKKIASVIINLVEFDTMPFEYYYKIFKRIFINPTGVLIQHDHPYTQGLVKAITGIMQASRSSRLLKEEVFNAYLNMDESHPRYKQLELMLLKLLIDHDLEESKVITRLIARLASGAIDIPGVQQGIDVFVKLSDARSLPLLNVLIRNLNYFIEVDGIEKVKEIIEHCLLLKPPQLSEVEQAVEDDLINKLKSINENIDIELLRKELIRGLSEEVITHHLRHYIMFKTIKCCDMFDEPQIKDRDLRLDWQLSKRVLQIILTVNDNKLIRSYIKNSAKSLFFGEGDLSDLQKEILNKIVDSVALTIKDIHHEQERFVKKRFFQELKVTNVHEKELYDVISKYFDWTTVIEKAKRTIFKNMSEEIISYDKQFTDSELYYTYVLATLAYRTYENILAIFDSAPDKYKQKLQLVLTYCQLSDAVNDEQPNSSLNLWVLKDNKNQQDCLLSLANLDYLNNKNITGFSLELFKVNYFNQEYYSKLESALIANDDKTDQEIINCLSLDSALFNN